MMSVAILAIIALIVFGWMRNSAAKRNDKRREKLREKQEELFENLKNKTSGDIVKMHSSKDKHVEGSNVPGL